MRRTSNSEPAVLAPILGDLYSFGFDEPECVGEILAKEPTAILIDGRHFVVPDAIGMIFLEKHLRVLDQEVLNLRLRERERQCLL